jgi:hypothetical protein
MAGSILVMVTWYWRHVLWQTDAKDLEEEPAASSFGTDHYMLYTVPLVKIEGRSGQQARCSETLAALYQTA